MLVTGFLVGRRKAFKGVGLGIVPFKPLASFMFEGIVKYREALHAYVHKRKMKKQTTWICYTNLNVNWIFVLYRDEPLEFLKFSPLFL